MDSKLLPRGLRNHNPFNIRRRFTNDWLGAVPEDAVTDSLFEQFIHPKYGVRAALMILHKYRYRGITRIKDIISTWAPSFENATGNYIEVVCAYTKKTPEDEVDIRIWSQVYPLLEAMFDVENGIALCKLPPNERQYWYHAILEGFELFINRNIKTM